MDFLVVVDYFSKFLIIRKLLNSTLQVVQKKLCIIFYEYDRPHLFKSCNEPYYDSE